jgi:predicted nucleotidyltransferase
MIAAVEDRRTEVAELCERYGVERLDLFGSASVAGGADNGFDPERSDLDFVVSFKRRDPQDLFGRYFGLEEDLQSLFGRKVDLVMEGALGKSRRFAANVEGSRVPLYGA